MNTIQQYLNSPDVKGLAESTRSLYTTALNYLEEFCQINGLIDLKNFQEKFYQFSVWLEKKHLSGKSVQQYLNCAKIFLKWAGHPVEFTYKISSEEKKNNKLKQARRWLNGREVELCLYYTFPNYNFANALQYRIIVRLLKETGVRVQELANIKAKDIDLEKGMAWITKSKTMPRPVFFSPQSKEMFEKLKDLSDDWQGKIFPSADRIKQVVNEMFEDLKLKDGKDGRGCHCFRHYTASYLYYVGNMNEQDIGTLLGDDAQTIRECYLHPESFPEELKKRISKAMRWE